MATSTTTITSPSSSSYSSLSSLPTMRLPSPKSFPFRRCFSTVTVTVTAAAVSENQTPATLPLRKIPGDCGIPLIGPWKDRQDYFYNQGKDEFFKSRIQKYQSTVFRTNMPPGPLFTFNSNVVALLDGKSFPTLFDTDKVEKKNLFTGTYMPSTALTGGHRILSFLDPSEPNHAKLKKLIFFLLRRGSHRIIPEFQSAYGSLFDSLEKDLNSEKKKPNFTELNEKAAFNFLTRSLLGSYPGATGLGSDGPKLVRKWVLFHLHPLLSLGLPRMIEDVLLHTFPLPPILIRKDYQRLYDFFYESSGEVLDEAETLGIPRDEACHNIVFAICFNSHGGLKIFFPNVIKWVGAAGTELHTELAKEIRSAVKSSGGAVTVAAVEKMSLLKSVVYEALRIEPPVASQYGKAKRDFVIESHDMAFEIRRGEMLYGFQPFATKDSRIFDRAGDFVPDRFIGDEGEKLLKHVLWSNGPEDRSPTVDDKQCAGKDFIVLASRLLLVELFRRYDTFGIDVKPSPLGVSVTVKSVKPASF